MPLVVYGTFFTLLELCALLCLFTSSISIKKKTPENKKKRMEANIPASCGLRDFRWAHHTRKSFEESACVPRACSNETKLFTYAGSGLMYPPRTPLVVAWQLLNGQVNKWAAIGGSTSPLKLHFKCRAIYMLNKADSELN